MSGVDTTPPRPPPPPPPAALLLSRDLGLLAVVDRGCPPPAEVERHVDARAALDWALQRQPPLAVVDDAVLLDSERGWFLDQLRRCVPDIRIIYVASRHEPAVERRMRGHGVVYYTAKPVDAQSLPRVVAQLLRRLRG